MSTVIRAVVAFALPAPQGRRRPRRGRAPVRWQRLAAGLLAAACILPLASARLSAQPRLGAIDFPTSTESPAAQEAFVTGVLWMHSFEYDKAAAAFRAAQQHDPAFAMAYWGEAMTHNHPVWNQRDAAAARAVLARYAPTAEARAARAPTPRERAWLHAVDVLYADGPKPARDSAYLDVMAALARNFPRDDEAHAFHALALVGLSQGRRDIPTYMRAGRVALDVFARNPRHPGAAHYAIHAFDDPDHAPLAVHAADAYAQIAPDAGHAQHMTTHIFLALGDWARTARQNVVAMQAARGDSDSLAWAPGHYTWWLHYARLQQGRWADARGWLEAQAPSFPAVPAGSPYPPRRTWDQVQAEYALTTDDARYLTGAPRAGMNGALVLAYGLAAERRGDAAQRRAAAAILDAECDTGDAELACLQAAQLHALGRALPRDSARRLLADAASREATMPLDFGPPAIGRPAHEAFAEWLAAQGEHANARAAFERALQRTPGRTRALRGLHRTLVALGDQPAAARVSAQLAENLRDADPDVRTRLIAAGGGLE